MVVAFPKPIPSYVREVSSAIVTGRRYRSRLARVTIIASFVLHVEAV